MDLGKEWALYMHPWTVLPEEAQKAERFSGYNLTMLEVMLWVLLGLQHSPVSANGEDEGLLITSSLSSTCSHEPRLSRAVRSLTSSRCRRRCVEWINTRCATVHSFVNWRQPAWPASRLLASQDIACPLFPVRMPRVK